MQRLLNARNYFAPKCLASAKPFIHCDKFQTEQNKLGIGFTCDKLILEKYFSASATIFTKATNGFDHVLFGTLTRKD